VKFYFQGECNIYYNGGGSTSTHAVAVIVEDHPANNPSAVLSYNSVQFVVEGKQTVQVLLFENFLEVIRCNNIID